MLPFLSAARIFSDPLCRGKIMNNPILDAGIPLLTEVIDAAERPLPAAVAGPSERIRQPQRESASRQETGGVNGWIDGEWTRLERQISERVLQQMLGRVD